ncbi:MAG: bifunctional UDP-N-acetylglucosamine diphosphorylase/glucosamine-1-phosphate N-acetyltransferase GlmU [Acidobacteria bacterium]|nr:bifunctional UDP-N-acetylglucosamine diphosphorylase/glucosamine-1-phosphate N-acetyltransferase GlmU [Acidobacteriota bacterium]MBI3662176.1 bifunctional UDP-N-acetylglucosamine diphosphorylase/glucosamine-1-phosphate N-acetyltransferase GlmU [Acidobacteriota bacterium]
MSANEFAVVVLAAGKGTRLKSALAKVLHRAGGRPLVEHVVRAANALKNKRVYVIVGHQADAVRDVIEPLGAKGVVQEPQNGTGHALLVARRQIPARVKYAVVVPGDAPLIRTETLQALMRAHIKGEAAATILSAMLGDPAGYGRIVRRADGRVRAIVEEKALGDEQRGINEVNSSIYCFTLAKLWPCLAKVRPENVHKEIYLTDAIALLDQQGERVLAEVAGDAREILGCNTRAELADVDRIFRERKRAALMDAGVTIYLPETVTIDADVQIGTDTIVEPNVQLLGKTKIGANCVVRSGSVIKDSVIADGCEVRQNCLVTATRLSSGVVVGPMAHLRDGAEIRAGARVGNFVEVKKSVLDEGVKAMHLTYLGDARVGRGTNVGAGTITCNYDGVRKNPTKIGKNVFVGSGTELIAPVKVGDGAYLAAGSTITDNVPKDALAIARGRQTTKPGWAAQRRKQLRAAATPKKKSRRR